MGRLFDAASALCGLRARANYEGQAAIELEAACDPHERGSYPIDVQQARELIVIDPRETIRALARDADERVAVGRIASRFHAAVIGATVRACALAAEAAQTGLVVLSGGVFQNRRLLEGAAVGLERAGLRVLIPQRLPIGDGGISYGQAAVAARLDATGGATDHERPEARMSGPELDAEAILAREVFIRGANRPFGELTVEDVSSRAQELRDAVGWGPTIRVAPVAQAWRELAERMRQEGAASVAAITAERLVELGPRLWMVLPGTGAVGEARPSQPDLQPPPSA